MTLTATAKSGSSFVGWLGACTGLVACRPVMNANQAVTARFLKGPFTLKIAGGGSGTGSGRVRSQTGLSPAINCTITSGTAAATGCSASYPAVFLTMCGIGPEMRFAPAPLSVRFAQPNCSKDSGKLKPR